MDVRIVVIDGTCFDVPDSKENARVFGRPSSRPETVAAFPKVRLVILVEAGTRRCCRVVEAINFLE